MEVCCWFEGFLAAPEPISGFLDLFVA